MTEAKHTPGPWMAAAGASSIVGWPVVAQTGRLVCSMATPPKGIDRVGKQQAEYELFMAEVGANARLIAAAPDLLKEAKAAVAFLTNKDGAGFGTTTMDGSYFYELAGNLEKALRAAISKAEGQ